MNWEKSENIAEIIRVKDCLLVLYGTSACANTLPVIEILSPDEIRYSERLKNDRQKGTWLSCRSTLRQIMGSVLNLNPAEIEFKKGRFGKLYVAGSNLFFNVSHSRSAFLIGFNSDGRIGIDIELLNGSEDLPLLVSYAFSAVESNYCQNGANLVRFVETWTLKEAFLKATGVGLLDQLSGITVLGGPKNEITQHHLNHKSFVCPNGEFGSIVYRNKKKIRFIQMS